MIRSLRVRDFQRHKHLKLKLDPHVTTIVGPSDVGKSALIRALMWTCLNRPRGGAFVRDGADHTSVTITLDGHRIRRTKGKTRNTYHIDGTKYRAFGNDVPKEVSALLNVGPVNFQAQHDPTFWFTDTPGEVSRHLNAIVDLSVIDTTLSNLATAQRTTRTEQGVVSERLRDARTAREGLEGFQRADTSLRELERDHGALLALRGQVQGLSELLQKAQEAQRVVDTLTNVPSTEVLEELGRVVERVRGKIARLEQLLGEVRQAQSELVQTNEELDATQAKLDRMMGDTCLLCGQTLQSQRS